MSLNESTVEDASLEWFGELGYEVGHGPQLAPGEPAAERDSFSEVVLVVRLRESIRRLNTAIQENVASGYRSNVWGLRGVGIAVSLLSVAVCGVRLYMAHASTGKVDEALCGAAAFSALILLLSLFRFTGDWVRVPADVYAERLVEAVETLAPKTTTEKK